MSKTINGDDLFEERRGRLVGRDHHQAAAKSRARNLLRIDPDQSRSGRGGRSFQPSTESVLKVVGWTKSHRAAPAQARYISRTADDKQPENAVTIEDQDGQQHTGRDAVDKAIAGWGLVNDRDNQSPDARKLQAELTELRKTGQQAAAKEKYQELNELTQRERLGKRQAVHLVFSLPASAGANAKNLEAASREALQESFGAAGHKYVFAVHTDHSARPHVHIIAKAESEPSVKGGKKGKSLRLGPNELHALRVLFTEKARSYGIDVTASRRIDRAPLRQQIAKGRAPLRKNLSKGKIHSQAQSKQGGIFASKAPNWYAANGATYERQRLAQFRGETPPAGGEKNRAGIFRRIFRQEEPGALPSGLPRVGQEPPAGLSAAAAHALKRLDRHFSQTYGKRAEQARESFIQMYREAPKLAVWAANKNPVAFGYVDASLEPPTLTARGLNGLLKAAEARPERSTARAAKPLPGQTQSAEQLRLAADAARDSAQQRRTVPAMEKQMLTAARQIERDAGAEGAAAAAKIRQLAGAALTPADKSSIMELERNRLVNRDQKRRGRDRGRDIE